VPVAGYTTAESMEESTSLSIYLSDDVCKKSNTEELHFAMIDKSVIYSWICSGINHELRSGLA
jgi:hypothetical protein